MTHLVQLLQDFHRDKLTALLRHLAGAKLVGQYDANNAYQYVIAREEVQLSWLSSAITELGGTVEESSVEPERGVAKDLAARRILEEDAREARAFVDRWRARVDSTTNARHRDMLRVILGETLEQGRTFAQALAGRTDLLGRHPERAGSTMGEVLPTRWIE